MKFWQVAVIQSRCRYRKDSCEWFLLVCNTVDILIVFYVVFLFFLYILIVMILSSATSTSYQGLCKFFSRLQNFYKLWLGWESCLIGMHFTSSYINRLGIQFLKDFSNSFEMFDRLSENPPQKGWLFPFVSAQFMFS